MFLQEGIAYGYLTNPYALSIKISTGKNYCPDEGVNHFRFDTVPFHILVTSGSLPIKTAHCLASVSKFVHLYPKSLRVVVRPTWQSQRDTGARK